MIANAGPVSVHITKWTEEGLLYGSTTEDGVMGVTIVDGDRTITYDYDTGNIALTIGQTDAGSIDALSKVKETARA